MPRRGGKHWKGRGPHGAKTEMLPELVGRVETMRRRGLAKKSLAQFSSESDAISKASDGRRIARDGSAFAADAPFFPSVLPPS